MRKLKLSPWNAIRIFIHIQLIMKVETKLQASSDQSTVDTSIFDLMGYVLFPVIELLGTIILMSRVAWPVFVIFVPIIAASLWYQVFFLLYILCWMPFFGSSL